MESNFKASQEDKSGAGKANVLFLFGLIGILLTHFVWEVLNETPPAWDMAYHQLKGWEYLWAWGDGTFFVRFAELSPQYPPLYYLVEAFVLGWFGNTQFLAILSNLTGIFLIAFSTFRLGCSLLRPSQAALAGLTAIALPMVAWISRDCLLDTFLAGWVAVACLAVAKSRWFTRIGWTVLFGLACAGGMLTKWTFPFYVFAPVVYALIQSENRKKSVAMLLLAALAATPFLLPYYGPNFSNLLSRYPTTEQSGLIPWQPYPRHGEPGLNNLLGWIYYPRVLASYFLQLPLLLVFVAGIFVGKGKRKAENGDPKGMLWFWLLGGILVLTLLTPKDPRFAVPLLPPLALLLFVPWREKPRVVRLVSIWVGFQFLAVSFSIPFFPSRLVLFEKKDRDYQTLQQEWVLLQTHYFEVAGPPRVEDWPYREILRMIPDKVTVGFLPDLSHFHPEGLVLEARKLGREIQIHRLGNSPGWARQLEETDFIISKSGFQGISFLTRFNEPTIQEIEKGGWSVAYTWPLPDGSQGTLWERLTGE